jgi:hypothetical protein
MRFRRGILVSSFAFVLAAGIALAQDADPTPGTVPPLDVTAAPHVPPPPGSEPATPLVQSTPNLLTPVMTPATTPATTPEVTPAPSRRTPRATRTPMTKSKAAVAAPPSSSSAPPPAAGSSSSAASGAAAAGVESAGTATSAEPPAAPPAPIVENPDAATAAPSAAREEKTTQEKTTTPSEIGNWVLVALAVAGLAIVVALVARRRKVERLSILDPMSLSSVHPSIRHAHRP